MRKLCDSETVFNNATKNVFCNFLSLYISSQVRNKTKTAARRYIRCRANELIEKYNCLLGNALK